MQKERFYNQKTQTKLKKSLNGNRRALSRKLVRKKRRREQQKKKVTRFELETRYTVGHNEVVALWQWPAVAIVTKNVPDFAVVAGNPAKVIRYRFDKPTREKLLKEECWENDINVLKNNIEDFIQLYEENN